MPSNFSTLDIAGLVLIEPKVFKDSRGFFLESYKYSEFKSNGISQTFVQINRSTSAAGVIRGLHYQLPPFGQGKLVSCIKGEIFDVAVDIRKHSPTFGKWHGVILSDQNKRMLFIPEGFAHGFYTLQETDVMYQTTSEYEPQSERGIIWNDPELNIGWPDGLKMTSEKDKVYPLLKNAEVFE